MLPVFQVNIDGTVNDLDSNLANIEVPSGSHFYFSFDASDENGLPVSIGVTSNKSQGWAHSGEGTLEFADHFYQGEQIGERRYYDERLTMFLLRYRDPVRYGAWLDGMEHQRHPDGAALTLSQAIDRVAQDGWADAFGVEREAHDPIATAHHLTEREVADARNQAMDREAEREKRAVLDGIDAIIAEVAEQEGKGQASGEGARGGT